jgi:hypothetical protein
MVSLLLSEGYGCVGASDYEGGNVSAHTVHLVSAVFLSFSLAL